MNDYNEVQKYNLSSKLLIQFRALIKFTKNKVNEVRKIIVLFKICLALNSSLQRALN